ncbi:MAG: polysaccharide biosynthesis protein [Acidimicrobiales bacterium]|nr:polysaccharide biosynthesis protein [Acidimicrobiales bacterium]
MTRATTADNDPSSGGLAACWMVRLGPTFERHRFAFQGGADALAWVTGVWIAIVLRYDFAISSADWGPFSLSSVVTAAVIAAVLQLVAGWLGGLYQGRFRYGSFEELAHLVRAVLVGTVFLALVNRLLSSQLVPMSVCFIGGFVALMVMAAARYTWRLFLDRSLRPSLEAAERALIFGAGEGGVQVITAMLRNPASPYFPIALLDDNPAKRNLQVMGVRVAGDRYSIATVARKTNARVLVIAIPSAGSELLRELTDLGLAAQLRVLALPPISELLGTPIGITDLRPVTEADLLGRHEIDTDIESVAGYLTGRRVLVTGAGGSIGSELCRQIARFAPQSLVMVDRDESALHGVQLLIEGKALLNTRDLVVADIRDRDRLREVFAEHRPQVVFHAAALKHLPLLELHPSEALKSNVVGTQNVIDVCTQFGVERFVNISTDKAADPTSVLGFSKRIAERLTAAAAHDTNAPFLSVRFGNVLGSRGSVLTTFHAQIAAGGPVTVTHPEVTRYFMTIEEAVQLVIQAGALGSGGEVLVLDMGQPVRIDDVARRLVAQADRPIEIVYTGLRRGEKLHEVLFGQGELDQRPAHPLIAHVPVPPLTFAEVEAAVATVRCDEDLVIELQALATASRSDERAGEPGG